MDQTIVERIGHVTHTDLGVLCFPSTVRGSARNQAAEVGPATRPRSPRALSASVVEAGRRRMVFVLVSLLLRLASCATPSIRTTVVEVRAYRAVTIFTLGLSSFLAGCGDDSQSGSIRTGESAPVAPSETEASLAPGIGDGEQGSITSCGGPTAVKITAFAQDEQWNEGLIAPPSGRAPAELCGVWRLQFTNAGGPSISNLEFWDNGWLIHWSTDDPGPEVIPLLYARWEYTDGEVTLCFGSDTDGGCLSSFVGSSSGTGFSGEAEGIENGTWPWTMDRA